MPLAESSIQLFSHVKAWIEPTLKAIGVRLDEFDLRLKAIPAIKGERGSDGKDVDPAVVQQLVETSVAKAVASIERVPGPIGKPGPIGPVGPVADPVLVTELIDKHVALAAALIPPAPPGANGKDADPEFIKLEVARAVSDIPKPKDGTDGSNGRDADPELMIAKIEEQFALMAAEFAEGLNDD